MSKLRTKRIVEPLKAAALTQQGESSSSSHERRESVPLLDPATAEHKVPYMFPHLRALLMLFSLPDIDPFFATVLV